MGLCRIQHRIIILSAALLFLCIGCTGEREAAADCYSLAQFRKMSAPSFLSYIMNVREGDGSRIDIYLLMPYNRLKFEKSSAGYRASYSISFIVFDSTETQVKVKEVDRIVEVSSYEATTAQSMDFFMQSFPLAPGNYTLTITSTDNLSQLLYRSTKLITAINYSGNSTVASTPLFLDTAAVEKSGVSLRPIFPELLTQAKNSFGIFQELYNLAQGDSVKFSMKYYITRKINEEPSSRVSYSPPYRLSSPSCFAENDSLLFSNDSLMIINNDIPKQVIQFFPIPPEGFVTLERTVVRYRNGKETVNTVRRSTYVRTTALPSTISLSEILHSMRYIMKNDEYDSLLAADNTLKIDKLKDFWSERGGEIRQKEFYKRIAEAKSLFTSCANGSSTPMGLTYIVCGAPDYIECRGLFSETWYYNVGERVMSVEFRALHSDHPEYYEITPFSVNETLWQYFVEKWRRRR
ncbi:MAG: GWxTD domain-containing protein [Bacteroidetes bacterium]|nr:GWxTD domain-containing protein [Bacteroidota bacterium]